MTSWSEVLEIRATDPGQIAKRLAGRRRRPLLSSDGNLFIIAADHTARGMLGVSDRPMVMADRKDLIERLLVALDDPNVDGLLGSADIIEDLVLLGALEEKVVIGTMNRGGLAGAVFELDDRMTAYDADGVARAGLDGGKMLLRVHDDDPGTVSTLEACARAVGELAQRGLMVMLEPLAPTPDAQVRAAAIAAALGPTSAYTWLKLPFADAARTTAATSLPALLLGGAPGPDPEAAFAAWEAAMALPTVRGLVVGRTLLFPPDDDVAGAVGRAGAIVHA